MKCNNWLYIELERIARKGRVIEYSNGMFVYRAHADNRVYVYDAFDESTRLVKRA